MRRVERDVIEIVNQGDGLLRRARRGQLLLVHPAKKDTFPISLLCEVLGVLRSGLHAWARRASA